MSNSKLADHCRRFGDLTAACAFTDSSQKTVNPDKGIEEAVRMLSRIREKNQAVYLVGNGGSAAVASHVLTDFQNSGRLRAYVLHEPALLTCMTNDYGYENAFARILSARAQKNDLLIAVSSSGKSPNILNTVKAARQTGLGVITFSGFKKDNPLRSLGDLNLWLDADDYGSVEVGHLFLLHTIADRLRLNK